MELSQFDFHLPEELIALRPANPRDNSKMLVHFDELVDDLFVNVTNYINDDDLIIINNSKVIPILLNGQKDGKDFSITLHKKIKSCHWMAFIKPSRKINVGDEITFENNYRCKVLQKYDFGEIELNFLFSDTEFDHFINNYGNMPLPPYIQKKRKPDKKDFEDYQTIFADTLGSVAAPTAGLHFSHEIMNYFNDKNQIEQVTLHVGAGTFMPIRDRIDKHKMHVEFGHISKHTVKRINECKEKGGKIIAVGTTTLRLLEGACKHNDDNLDQFNGEIDIFIKPGFKFKIVDKLITNFHLPKSTLMLLISAFAGIENVSKMYKHAIEKKYRFFSYGDASFLTRNNNV
tara:strand:- start:8206 stop:9240 length:1035 start_codon:yes stop_codon:yes gene_type:complete